MTDLGKLIERVEAGTVEVTEFMRPNEFSEFTSAIRSEGHQKLFVSAYNGSVDAALALKVELLSDIWALEMTYRPFGIMPNLTFVTLTKDHTGYGNGTHSSAQNKSPARALLLATLKAYQWEKEQ